jgi:DNA-binding helix-hairpin-helix protein with protein kinase domain
MKRIQTTFLKINDSYWSKSYRGSLIRLRKMRSRRESKFRIWVKRLTKRMEMKNLTFLSNRIILLIFKMGQERRMLKMEIR